MPKLELPMDFAKAVADALGWKLTQVDDTFEFEEDKAGFFWAKLKPKKFLEKSDFRTVCALARDFGGEGYLLGAKAWKVPGPYAKRTPATEAPVTMAKPIAPVTTSTPVSSVVPDSVKYDKSTPPELPNIKFIFVDAVKIPPFLPTRELVSYERLSEIRESIKKHGLKYPIKVRPGPDSGTYELKDGYLRLESVRQLGWKEILAEIKDTSDQEVIVESIITNKNRIEEDPITVAKKLDILVNAFGYTQEKIAEELGASREWIANVVRLLRLPKEIQDNIAIGKLGFRHGLTLLTVNNVDLQLQLAKETVEQDSTISELERRIDELQPKPKPLPAPEVDICQVARRATESQDFATRHVAESQDIKEALDAELRATLGQPKLPSEQGMDSEVAYKGARNEIPEPTEEPGSVTEKAPEPEPLLTGFEVECPECHAKLLINHIHHPNGKVEHEVEA